MSKEEKDKVDKELFGGLANNNNAKSPVSLGQHHEPDVTKPEKPAVTSAENKPAAAETKPAAPDVKPAPSTSAPAAPAADKSTDAQIKLVMTGLQGPYKTAANSNNAYVDAVQKVKTAKDALTAARAKLRKAELDAKNAKAFAKADLDEARVLLQSFAGLFASQPQTLNVLYAAVQQHMPNMRAETLDVFKTVKETEPKDQNKEA